MTIPLPRLHLPLLVLLQLQPSSSFLPITPDPSNYATSVQDALTFHCGTTSPQLVFPMTTMQMEASQDHHSLEEEAYSDAEEGEEEEEGEHTSHPISTPSTSVSIDSSNNALLQAKLSVLQDVVVQLNLTKCEDQKEIQTLKSQVGDLRSSSRAKEKRYEEKTEEHLMLLQQQQAKETEFKERTLALKSTHQTALHSLTQKLLKQAQEEQDALKKELLKETTDRKLEWKESLEIANSAVAAAGTREQALMIKLDDLETRYHTEAAQYKTELRELQKDWKKENSRLEKEITRLSMELQTTKTSRDKETTALLDQLGERSTQLEDELKVAREQIQFQKLQFSTQQEVAKENWQEQREKERRFYTEAIKLLQQESRPSIWRRIFKGVFGSGKSGGKGGGFTGRRVSP